MGEVLVRHEAVLYGSAFFGAIALFAVCEALAPRRALAAPFRARWLAHAGFAVIDPLVVRALLPLLDVAAAAAAAERGFGLFHHVPAPRWLAGLLSLLALDFVRYAQHRLLHGVPLLWRLHRMHHTDVDYDFTTALRFHPLESLFTGSIGVGAVLLLGAPVEAVVVNEILFVAVAFFAHANLRLPLGADPWLRLALVTPDFHRVHHSARPGETNSNYGSVLPLWDRLLGSYVAQPAGGHEAMRIGLAEFREAPHRTLPWMLANPFLADRGSAGPRRGGGAPRS
jgi:sterol desaturase/sphingolipid hydroxylase (fatty acid hydroxylase superfamily)